MFFSIVIPVFNRERFIARCLRSVFLQEFASYEVVLVDDGSLDGSLAAVGTFTDPRLRLLRHERNRGVGPARNTGILASRGDWLIFLDSDDELAPGALSGIHDIADGSPPDLHAHWFRCRLDDGRLSPDPMPREEFWDYEGFIRFIDESRGRSTDMLRCVRRSCFEEVSYPDSRMFEDKFHLDFARRFRSHVHSSVMRLYHQDADNRFIDYLSQLDPVRDSSFLTDRADGYAALLREHGASLKRVAPALYADHLRLAAISALWAGRQRQALGYAARLLLRAPLRAGSWAVLGASLAGSRMFHRIWRLRRNARRWRGKAA